MLLDPDSGQQNQCGSGSTTLFFVLVYTVYFTSIFVRNRWDKLLFAPLDQGELKWGSINKAVNEIINPHPGRHIFEVENLFSVASFVQSGPVSDIQKLLGIQIHIKDVIDCF
jgi:hypothetical protein